MSVPASPVRAPARAYVALGSNLDDPAAHVRRARYELDELPGTRVVACSPLYLNPPMGPAAQPDYVNAVAAVDTRLAPLELLHELQAIERAHGRVRRGERWGPRTLDLDLLVHGGESRADAELTLPHPGIATRPFVLRPLCDIAPDACIPGFGTARQLLAHLPPYRLRALSEETTKTSATDGPRPGLHT